MNTATAASPVRCAKFLQLLMTLSKSVDIERSLIPEWFSKIGSVRLSDGTFIIVAGTSYKEIRIVAFDENLKVVDSETLSFDGAYFSASIHPVDTESWLIYVAKTEIISSNTKQSSYQGYSSFWYSLSFSDGKIDLKQAGIIERSDVFAVDSKDFGGTRLWMALKVTPKIGDDGEYDTKHTNAVGYSKSGGIPTFHFFEADKSIGTGFDFSIDGNCIHLFAPTNFNKIISHFTIDTANSTLKTSDLVPKFGRKFDQIGGITLVKGEGEGGLLFWNTINQESNNADRTLFYSKLVLPEVNLNQQRLIKAKDLDTYVIGENPDNVFVLSSCYGSNGRRINFTVLNKDDFFIKNEEEKGEFLPLGVLDAEKQLFLAIQFGTTTRLLSIKP